MLDMTYYQRTAKKIHDLLIEKFSHDNEENSVEQKYLNKLTKFLDNYHKHGYSSPAFDPDSTDLKQGGDGLLETLKLVKPSFSEDKGIGYLTNSEVFQSIENTINELKQILKKEKNVLASGCIRETANELQLLIPSNAMIPILVKLLFDPFEKITATEHLLKDVRKKYNTGTVNLALKAILEYKKKRANEGKSYDSDRMLNEIDQEQYFGQGHAVFFSPAFQKIQPKNKRLSVQDEMVKAADTYGLEYATTPLL
ncbi:MAG: hypothetical protein GY782_09645 [Gammaproteobacteria bacterium]|nr:hypothetical protein [Gammaproteobacteria bacterium]